MEKHTLETAVIIVASVMYEKSVSANYIYVEDIDLDSGAIKRFSDTESAFKWLEENLDKIPARFNYFETRTVAFRKKL